jgi:hypothetical protein
MLLAEKIAPRIVSAEEISAIAVSVGLVVPKAKDVFSQIDVA